MSDKWYYIDEGKRVGPLNEHALCALVRDGKLRHDSYVWHGGMDDWHRLSDTELAKFVQQEAEKAEELLADRELEPQLPAGEISFTAQSLHRLWVWFVLLVAASFPLGYVLNRLGAGKVVLGTVVVMNAVVVSIIGYTLLYRCWSLIQDKHARTTPGRAVGFCLVPFYNIYWNYVAYVGLAKDMNAYCARYGVNVPRVDERLALAWYAVLVWYLLSFMMNIQGLSSLLAVVLMVTQTLLLRQFVAVARVIVEIRNLSNK